MKDDKINQCITNALAIEVEEAQKSGTLGFMARALTMATLPHKATEGNEFSRSNGSFTLSIMVPRDIGLPYGIYPRLLLCWLTSEALQTRSPVLKLGNTLSGFMMELGLVPTGGRWGNVTRLRDQIRRLFSSSISCSYNDKDLSGGAGFRLTKEYNLWWEPKHPEQGSLFNSTVTLSLDFFQEIIDKPVPVDMGAFKKLKNSPMALDIYCWLNYRTSYLNKSAELPWGVLQMQFGSAYAQDAQGSRDFKKNFIKHLKTVSTVYSGSKISLSEKGLLLQPTTSSVKISAPNKVITAEHKTPKVAPRAPLRLLTETYQQAKQAAPGFDVYALEQEWRDWLKNRELPKNPNAAFIGFCKRKYQKQSGNQ